MEAILTPTVKWTKRQKGKKRMMRWEILVNLPLCLFKKDQSGTGI
jgi:hypothetical protein